MAMKLYNDTAVQSIANSIRKINGENTTYTISQMSPAIDTAFSRVLSYVPYSTLNGTTNQTETIQNGAELPFISLKINGLTSQSATPTIYDKVDVIPVNSATLTLDDGNNNTKTIVLDFEGTELYSLQDGTKDTLKIENGHLYVDKKIKKIQFTTSMNYSWYNTKKSIYIAEFAQNYGITRGDTNLYSNCFTKDTTVWNLPYKIGWGGTNTTLWFTFNTAMTDFTSATGFKNWVAQNECYVIGKMSTPETIDLGEITSLFLYDGTNNVILTTNLGTTYNLKYYTN